MALLESQKRLLERNLVLERSAGLAYQKGDLDGLTLASILGDLGWIRRKILNPARNNLGQSCWDMSKASNGVVMRWIYGGGNIGTIAEGLLGIPRGGAGQAWNLDWRLADVLAAMGIGVPDCEGYFASIRQRYAKIDAATATAGTAQKLAAATREELGDRSRNVLKPVDAPPEQSIMPLVLGIAGVWAGSKFLGSYLGARSRKPDRRER